MPKGGNKHDKHEVREERQEARQDTQHDRQDIKELFAELKEADEFYFADFNEINGSGVEGFGLITVDRNGPGSADDTITVRIAASGLQEGVHAQHIHGFENGTEAVTPTSMDDVDGDGLIEVAEGQASYGPILVNLTPFPATEEGGSFVFERTFHLPSGDEGHDSEAHAGDAITTFDNLDLNHFVIHGLRVEGAEGPFQNGTLNEFGDEFVNGVKNAFFDPTEYKDFLPVAVGEIEQGSLGQAHQFLKQAYSDGFDFIA